MYKLKVSIKSDFFPEIVQVNGFSHNVTYRANMKMHK